MISKEEVKKLATLARLEFEDAELTEMQEKLGAILDYVGQINNVLTDAQGKELPELRNIAREDAVLPIPESTPKSLLKEAPQSEEGFVKVKKIIA